MFLKRLASKAHDYKYRFVPWILVNWKKRSVKEISLQENDSFLNQAPNHISTLLHFFEKLNTSNVFPEETMMRELGFCIKRQRSSLINAGSGVIVASGRIKQDTIVALYPGTVYYPMEPIFFQSLGNPFILKCIDGILIDGNNKGISKRIYRSSAARDKIGPYLPCDTSWLLDKLSNPLSIGQYINNATTDYPANVTYMELDIPTNFPLHLLKYIPNIHFNNPVHLKQSQEESRYIRTVILLALRDITEGEELFSSYYTQIQKRAT
ncbi:SET domain-containing protein 9-like [Hydractinia symbiolongicarpus]|uniref:SET domain-containing protein 9-like n=1 Tax=Hydractinia symbiolongicarpus TaxID=13093 RepID=UPI00254FC5B6|nr:SET domain-containing protein 9-like [Hydractinia symbiolongicarpus]XP_057299671.1 SET domain-containing protein 9-like [Hydractinia symbiolongicarpus]